jgi:hypothetical protein
MAFSEKTALALVDKPRSDYQCNHVVNEALNGNKLDGGTARSYLTWGSPAVAPGAGVVVVGKDGVHVGVFISALEFIHSSSKKSRVIRAPLSQLPYVFPNGYVLRRQ